MFGAVRNWILPASLCASLAVAGALAPGRADAATTLNVGVTNDFAGWNPYADSTALMYMIWCQTYGCLGLNNVKTGGFDGMLAESWEVNPDNKNEWTIRLRKGLKRHGDGKELTAEDVVHSVFRNKKDPHTAQSENTSPVVDVQAVDKYTVKFITKAPTASLLSYLFERLIITGKDLWDKGGAEADRKTPWGWGPYSIKEIVVGRRMVIEKNPEWPGIKPENPDRIVYHLIKEDEARVTALLNGELQIAAFIPPHLMPRVEKAANVTVKSTPSSQVMFLAMNVKFKPWENKLVRQAVAHAIDRKSIVKSILRDGAEIIDGPVGPGQYGYTPDVTPKYDYDPAKAKALLAQAGFPNGVDISFVTPNGRYPYDRQLTQAMVPMLQAAGFRVKYQSIEWSTYWADVRKGKQPFYYQGRSSVIDPSAIMSQYFQTGGSPRIGYSNPELDAALAAERAEFDPDKRKALLQKAFNLIQENVPGYFLWRSKMYYGVAKNVDFTPTPDETVYGAEIVIKK